ncbi:MAG: radical SAM family heme chaperone HemW, partial [Spongiibacteraceae bacterium]
MPFNAMQLGELPPLGLYIHIPWCVRKCPYCDFNSHTTAAIPEQEYVNALIDDLEQELQFVQGRPLQSIFFGGGTPSLFSGAAIARILTAVEQRIPFAVDIEITLEANPGTVEQGKFSAYAAAGVNRLSIGVQSFNADHLKTLGRIHSNQEAIKAAHTAIKAGINNFNIDLMHGLPKQTEQQALQDIEQAIALNPTHISWYQLTIEPNTAFYSAPPTLPDDDRLADIQDAGEHLLSQANFQQYEISAYSRNKAQSRHNTNYWLFGDYIGIGAGAHGKLTLLHEQQIIRRWKTRSPKDYLASDKEFIAGSKVLQAEELPLEFFLNSLRLTNGFSSALFQARTGLSLSAVQTQLAMLNNKKLLSISDQSINTTPLGRRFLNSILAEF